MNILVVFTGGTIGSLLQNSSISTNSASRFELIDNYEKNHLKKDVNFFTISPFSILSETITSSHWTTLIQSIENYNLNQIDAIIITHGTDTLSFTANALALYLNIPIPVILVSSHMPLNEPHTNGNDNFKAAIDFAFKKISGVYVAYKNPQEKAIFIFNAHEITQSPQLSSRFDAVNDVTALVYLKKIIFKFPIKKVSKPTIKLKPFFSNHVLFIRPYPAIDYKNYKLDFTKAILHDLYHSGTCDTNKLKPFLMQCKRANIPIFMAPIKSSQYYYKTTQELMDLDVHFLYDISIEHALAKVMLAVSNFNDEDKIVDYLQNF